MCKVPDCKADKIIAKGYCQYHYDRKRRYGDVSIRPSQLACKDCKKLFAVRPTGNVPVVCDECKVERHRARQRNDRRRKGLWAGYKITLADYAQMFADCGGVCEICKRPTAGRGKKNNNLSVDHNHETGKIRGLLCSNCNTGLGLFADNPDLLIQAINYLKEKNG